MASFNIGNSCPITIFHRGLDAASNHRCGGRFCVYQRVPPAACCWLYELKRGILMSAGEGRFAKGRGISIPVNIDGVKKKKRGGGGKGIAMTISRKICRFVLIRRLNARFSFFTRSRFSHVGPENSSPAPKLIFTIRAVHNRARFIANWRRSIGNICRFNRACIG